MRNPHVNKHHRPNPRQNPRPHLHAPGKEKKQLNLTTNRIIHHRLNPEKCQYTRGIKKILQMNQMKAPTKCPWIRVMKKIMLVTTLTLAMKEKFIEEQQKLHEQGLI